VRLVLPSLLHSPLTLPCFEFGFAPSPALCPV